MECSVLILYLSLAVCGSVDKLLESNDIKWVPQAVSSKTFYGYRNKQFFVYDGEQKEIPLKLGGPTYKYSQYGDKLLVWDGGLFDGLTIANPDGTVKKLALPINGRVGFVTIWNDLYVVGGADLNQVYVYTFNGKGEQVDSDLIMDPSKPILYARGAAFALVFQDNLWVYSPAHETVYVYEKHLKEPTRLSLDLPEFIHGFNPETIGKFFKTLEEDGKVASIEFAKKHEDEVLKSEPISMILYKNQPALLYNLYRMGTKLNPDGEPHIRFEFMLLDLEGKVVRHGLDKDGLGLLGDGLLTGEQYSKNSYIHRVEAL